ncbi:carbohydrate kinase [Rossellomorea aquimaris]|jgi:fructokinase|uniref:Carbohydrate kinase n=1 Tax=Rossellomorea aquimaris TaxID=189382 RepID=A0A5D4UMR7_9BACI|nr:carbohydrate kinase [Rossellomorea aquimaris]TYS81834.1 carbohydrate kinase [Rossellomorea aquimaris]TYS88458.1 carbohydrate kinase [Rossellomorea aquimaris]
MAKLFSIGEVLIDFIPLEKGVALKDVLSFERAPGGAPANVAAAVAKFGQESVMISKLGLDAFGDFLVGKLAEVGVNTDFILRTDEANTALAFVSLKEDGERDFSFYRNPSADLLLDASELNENMFGQGDFLHFCSVDLVESPMKYTHEKAIDLVKSKHGIISFDPNVRLPLWEKKEDCRRTILEFLPKAHIVKVSDEELEFITGIPEEKEALNSLFRGDVEVVIYTQGAKGATVLTKDTELFKQGFQVDAVDTTGAGDAFIGGFLTVLIKNKTGKGNLKEFVEKNSEELLMFANASGALTTANKGGINALPSIEEIEELSK